MMDISNHDSWKASELIGSAILIIMLSSCTPKFLEPTIITKTKLIYPSVPSIQSPIKPMLEPIKFDWPRDLAVLTIKNSNKCKTKFKELYPNKDPLSFKLNISDPGDLKGTDAFWVNCGINPPDSSSNLYIGLDQSNYKNLVANFKGLYAREFQWNLILKRVNGMLEQWRNSDKQIQTKDDKKIE